MLLRKWVPARWGRKGSGIFKGSRLGVAPVRHLIRSSWDLVQHLSNQDLGSVMPRKKLEMKD